MGVSLDAQTTLPALIALPPKLCAAVRFRFVVPAHLQTCLPFSTTHLGGAAGRAIACGGGGAAGRAICGGGGGGGAGRAICGGGGGGGTGRAIACGGGA